MMQIHQNHGNSSSSEDLYSVLLFTGTAYLIFHGCFSQRYHILMNHDTKENAYGKSRYSSKKLAE